jgi:NAD-dependent deacetylase
MLALWARPNAAHQKLAELESAGRLKAVITQNIDGLHQMAGSREVLELHGSSTAITAWTAASGSIVSYITGEKGVPKCDRCGGTVRPDVVLL